MFEYMKEGSFDNIINENVINVEIINKYTLIIITDDFKYEFRGRLYACSNYLYIKSEYDYIKSIIGKKITSIKIYFSLSGHDIEIETDDCNKICIIFSYDTNYNTESGMKRIKYRKKVFNDYAIELEKRKETLKEHEENFEYFKNSIRLYKNDIKHLEDILNNMDSDVE